jgi:hypothetical protein
MTSLRYIAEDSTLGILDERCKFFTVLLIFLFFAVAWFRFTFAREIAQQSVARVTALVFVTPRGRSFFFGLYSCVLSPFTARCLVDSNYCNRTINKKFWEQLIAYLP